MIDIEKVLNGLQHCIEKLDSVIHKTHGFNCLSCSYLRKCESIGYLSGLPLMRDALALLKAQLSRVLTLEEVHVVEVCWLEEKGYEPFATLEADSWNHNTYNRGWRCWSAKPTDEQRKEVEWDA